MASRLEQTKALQLVVTGQALSDDFQLEDKPVEKQVNVRCVKV